MVHDPAGRRPGIIYRRRERELGRKPIVHGNHEARRAETKPATGDIVGTPIADHEPSTVEIDEDRERAFGILRAIESHRKLATGAGDHAFLRYYSGRGIPGDPSNHVGVLDPRRWRIEALERGAGAALREVEYELGLRI
jgi:hypothetical protein